MSPYVIAYIQTGTVRCRSMPPLKAGSLRSSAPAAVITAKITTSRKKSTTVSTAMAAKRQRGRRTAPARERPPVPRDSPSAPRTERRGPWPIVYANRGRGAPATRLGLLRARQIEKERGPVDRRGTGTVTPQEEAHG